MNFEDQDETTKVYIPVHPWLLIHSFVCYVLLRDQLFSKIGSLLFSLQIKDTTFLENKLLFRHVRNKKMRKSCSREKRQN